MADYSGYTPQRQQQRQDPWADAAVGIAKLFMPDQEQQFKARQFQQTEELNTLRLKDHKTETAAREARTLYDNDRLAEAKLNRGLLDEKGRIMAEAARTGGLTQAQAGRLAEINSRLGGADSSVANVYALTPEGKAATAAAAKAKADATSRAAADKQKAEDDANAAAAVAKDTESFYSAKAKEAKEYKPPSDADMANAFKAVYRSISGGRRLSDGAIAELVTASQRGQFTGTPAQVADKIMKIAFAGSHAGHVVPLYDAARIEAEKKKDPVAAANLALEDDFKPGVTTSTEGARKNLQNVQIQYPGTYYLEGTMDEIREQAMSYPPGTRIVYLDVKTGKHGGGRTPSDESVYMQQSDQTLSPDGLHRSQQPLEFDPWFNTGITPPNLREPSYPNTPAGLARKAADEAAARSR
jgi:hypothetical protein